MKITVDFTLIIFGVLLSVTIVAAFEYYKQIRKAQIEYEKARGFVEDIVLSFDRELKRESIRFESMASKVDGSYSAADASYRRADNLEKRIVPFEEQLSTLSQSIQLMSQNFLENTQNNTNFLSGLAGLESKLKDIEEIQETFGNKLIVFEKEIQKLSVAPAPQENNNEIMLTPLLIKRDKALAALTDTEITVLEMLYKEGAKTAPEIKERVHLSREHTARLMKKLYEEGYLEREAGKIPFRYTIKKEMEVLLQKTENQTT